MAIIQYLDSETNLGTTISIRISSLILKFCDDIWFQ